MLGLLTWAAKFNFVIFAIRIVLIIFANKSIFRIDKNGLTSWWKIGLRGNYTCFDWSGKIRTAHLNPILIPRNPLMVCIGTRSISTYPIRPALWRIWKTVDYLSDNLTFRNCLNNLFTRNCSNFTAPINPLLRYILNKFMSNNAFFW